MISTCLDAFHQFAIFLSDFCVLLPLFLHDSVSSLDDRVLVCT